MYRLRSWTSNLEPAKRSGTPKKICSQVGLASAAKKTIYKGLL